MIEDLARGLFAHRAEGRPRDLSEGAGDIETAYRIQEAGEHILVEEHGFRPIGYKIAATNAASREIVGTDEPFFGRLYRQLTALSPATLDADGHFFHVHEPEIALRIGRDLDASGAPYAAGDIAAATTGIMPAIEIIATAFSPWREAGAANLIADNAAHGHWIVGRAVADWSGLDLMDGPVVVTVDGAVVAEGRGRNVDGGPFAAAAWLANALAARGRKLVAGDQITTGTTTPPIPILGPGAIRADFGDLGVVDVDL